MPKRILPTTPAKIIACLGLALSAFTATAATVVWNGASGTDTNWSTGGNWIGGAAPLAADNVKFFDAGTNGTAGVANQLVDGGFNIALGSLQYGNTNGFHTTAIAAGQTLNITGSGGLTVGTLTDNGSAQTVTASITGANGTLNLANSAAVLLVDQGKTASGTATQRATLDMSGLGTFQGNFNCIIVGATMFAGANNVQVATGTLKLAQTNVITTAFVGTPITSNVASPTNSIEIGGDNGNGGGVNYLYLGQTNSFYIDSIGVGTLKTIASMLFNPVFVNPSAYFRGTNGANSRIRFWTIGDMSSSGSSSALALGTNDFSGGSVDILVDTMSLGRDRQGGNTSAANATKGILTFTAGTIDVNNLYVGNQQWTAVGNANPMIGVVNVRGATATLVVNSNLVLGRTTANSAAATSTSGTLTILDGTVRANLISLGTNSTVNNLIITNGTLAVSNTVASPSHALSGLTLTNATLQLSVVAAQTNIVTTNLTVVGTGNNTINIDTAATFAAYPAQVTLIKYTALVGSYNFVLGTVPASAPGAYLSNNVANSSIDLVLPSDPRPVITAQPSTYSGSPSDNVSTNFSVSIAGTSVSPLTYQWYKDGVAVVNGATGNGSTFAGATTSTLTLANAQPADNASTPGYLVVITNVYGAATSSPAVLSISAGDTLPLVTGPNSATVIQGNNATFTASVAGNPTPAIQWQRGGTNIPGATTATLIVNNVQYATDDQAVYSIIASNVVGSVTNSATLTVIVRPAISAQPVSLVVTNSQAAAFTVVATGVPSPAYQWLKNGSPLTDGGNISGSSTATLSFAGSLPGDIGNYSVTITNLAGATNSVSVSLTVNSLMEAASLSPNNSATGVFYDTPLAITFSAVPTLRSAGTIKIFNVTNSATPVDTINLALGNAQQRTFPGDAQSFTYNVVSINGSTATIYPHSSVMTSNQTYYVTLDNGVFADASGAYFAGITATNAWQFTTKTGGAANPTSLIVAADGSGDFLTVQGAVNAIPSGNTTPRLIHVRNGDYNEIVDIAGKHNVTFRGQSRLGAVVGYANNATFQTANSGTTHARMAFKVNANDIAIENMTITNRTPVGGSQAEALMVESNARRFIFNNAHVGSYQDTILVNQNSSECYFNNSQIEGQFDYIWGGGRLFFTNCEVRTLVGNGGALNTGNLTASRTDLAGTNGFSFMRCQFTRITNTLVNTTVAGANGTAGGNVAYISCNFADNYTNPSSGVIASQILWEFGNSNLDNTVSRAFGLTVLTEGDGRLNAARTANIWLNGWNPQLAPNILTNPASQSAAAGAAVTLTVSATGIPEPTYQWQHAGTNLASATAATLAIGSAQRSDAGNYTVIVNNGSGSVTSAVATLTYTGNVVPVASPASAVRPAGFSLKIAVAGLSAHWSDADGDPVALTAAISSTNGASVSYDSNYVYYSSANDVADRIDYTIGDGQGGTGAGVIDVSVSTNPVAGTPQAIIPSGGSVVLKFAGIPTFQYDIQRSTNLVDWVTLLTTNAPANGLFMFTDDFTDLGGTPPVSAFYRTAKP